MYPKLSKSRYNVESVLELIRFVLMLLLQLAKSRDVKSLLKWVYYFFGELYFGWQKQASSGVLENFQC